MKKRWWIWSALAGLGLSADVIFSEATLALSACLLFLVMLVPLSIFAYRRTAPKRLFWMRLMALVISSTCAYALAEVVFRVHRYGQLRHDFLDMIAGFSTDEELILLMPYYPTPYYLKEYHRALHQATVFDPDIGYRFRPKYLFEFKPKHAPLRKWRTNSHGHISDDEYPLAKPAGEFRIITIGDSFTDGHSNTIRWQTVLQKKLNDNAAWREFVGKKFTRVLNLGMHAIGIGQFQAVYDFEGRKFEPDIVVLNFITDDINRRWYSKGRIKTMAEAENVFRTTVVESDSWYRVYPELLAATSAGKALGLRSHLNLLSSTFDTEEEGIRVSADAVAHIVQLHPRTLLTLHPGYDELKAGQFPAEMRDFEAALGETKVCYMSRFLAQFKKDDSSYDQWFQRPADNHPSDLGQEIYGAAMEMALLEYADTLKAKTVAP